ncbi:MAG: recombinase family protein [Gemmatimonadota bacterium]|nr:recombinase family protein [Gemmatimonadota bacterium]
MQIQSQPPQRPAAFYGRVSGRDSESIDQQLVVVREIAARDGYFIPNGPRFVFQDVNITGASQSRNGFDALEALVTGPTKPEFDRLYVRDFRRFGRWKDPRRHDYYAVLFENHGVEIRYCSVERHVEYSEGMRDSDFGQYFVDKVDQAHGSRELTEMSLKFRRAKRDRVIKGFYPTGLAPHGFKFALVHKHTREVYRVLERGERMQMVDHHFILVPGEEAELEVVRFIFDSAQGGRSIGWITKDLNRRKVPTPGRPRPTATGEPREPRWNESSVRIILHRELYAGTLIWARDKDEPAVPHTEVDVDGTSPIRYEGFIEDPPISKEQFAAVHEVLRGRGTVWDKRRTTRPKSLLTGKIRCARCGSGIHANRFRVGKRSRAYYVHNKRSRATEDAQCPFPYRSVKRDTVDALVIAEMRGVLADEDLAERVRGHLHALIGSEGLAENQAKRAALRKRMAARETEVVNQAKALAIVRSQTAHARLTSALDTLGTAQDADKAQLLHLEAEEQEIRALIDGQVTRRSDATDLLHDLNGETDQVRRRVIDEIVEYVEYNFETHELTIALRVS